MVKDIMITNGAIFSSRKDLFMKAQTILKRRAVTGSGFTDRWSVFIANVCLQSCSYLLPGESIGELPLASFSLAS